MRQYARAVVLVIDIRGMTRGIAPLLRGYRDFDEGVSIVGVILNQVGGPRHEAKLRAAVARYTELPVLGARWRDPALELGERHLGLVPSAEDPEAETKIARPPRRSRPGSISTARVHSPRPRARRWPCPRHPPRRHPPRRHRPLGRTCASPSPATPPSRSIIPATSRSSPPPGTG